MKIYIHNTARLRNFSKFKTTLKLNFFDATQNLFLTINVKWKGLKSSY